MLNFLKCTGQSSTRKSSPVQNVNSIEYEKLCHKGRYSGLREIGMLDWIYPALVCRCAHLRRNLCDPPLSMGFSSQEYCSGFPFPPPGDLPDPGIEPTSLALAGSSLPLSHQGSPDNADARPVLSTCHVY